MVESNCYMQFIVCISVMQYSSELQRRVLAKSNYLIVLPSNNSLYEVYIYNPLQ